MPTSSVPVQLAIEIAILVLFLLIVAFIVSLFIYRDVKKAYKEVWKHQSRFDIELRKTYNLVSKLVRDPEFDRFRDVIVKDLPHDEKRALLTLVESAFAAIDHDDPDNRYVVETYQNLLELRIVLDAKVLGYNQKISLFPFNVFARVFRMTELRHYTPHP